MQENSHVRRFQRCLSFFIVNHEILYKMKTISLPPLRQLYKKKDICIYYELYEYYLGFVNL